MVNRRFYRQKSTRGNAQQPSFLAGSMLAQKKVYTLTRWSSFKNDPTATVLTPDGREALAKHLADGSRESNLLQKYIWLPNMRVLNSIR